MEINKIGPSFTGLKIGKMPAFAKLSLPTGEQILEAAKSADVFIKISEKDFPYIEGKISKIKIPALKISARPLKLTLFEKLFNKRTVTEYFPVGNMKDSVVYDKSKSVSDVIYDVVSKVK